MKININDIGGALVKEDDRYVVKDNNDLKNLVVSSTDLNPGKQTTGHSHAGQEEVYIFVQGKGRMLLGSQKGDDLSIEDDFPVKEGDVVLIEDGKFHRVVNDSKEKLYFVCVFDGNRTHQKTIHPN